METTSHKMKTERATFFFNILGYTLITLITLLCLLPFIMMLSGSFSTEAAVSKLGFSLFPREFTTSSYKILFRTPETILRAYGVTIFITVVGTALGLFITAMTAYVMSRKDFKYRNHFSFFFYFTTLFNGGMVSSYIFIIRYLHLKDSLISLIFPMMINVFYLLIMRSFMSDTPLAIIESAKMDGASEFRIFVQIVLPLTKAGLATIGLFIALEYWNDWYNAMLYLNSSEKFPLQYMLYNLMNQAEAMSKIASQANISMTSMPTQTLKMAMAVIATGPIILVYPFVQKYFVKGITIGAVKG